MTGTLHEDLCTFMIILNLAKFFLELEMFQTKLLQKIKTHFVFNSFFSENRTDYEIMWKNFKVGQTTDDNIIRRMRFACWITKATNTHSEYVILIAFPPRQVLDLHAPLCYIFRYVACLVTQRNSFSHYICK